MPLAPDKNNHDSHIDAALALKREGRWDEALSELDKAAAQCANNRVLSRIRTERAQIYFEKCETQPALAEARAAAALDPANAHACAALGAALKRDNQYGLAAAEYARALKLCGDSKETAGYLKGELAQLFYEKGDLEQAAAECEKALKEGFENEQLHLTLGAVKVDREEYSEARKEFEKAVKLNPSGKTLRELVKIYKVQKNIDSCIEISGRYLEVEEKNDPADNTRLEASIRRLAAAPPRGDLKVKMIRTPHFEPRKKVSLNYSLLLPSATGQIVAYLKASGIVVDQDDLYIKINYGNRFGKDEDKIDETVFFDEKRIIAYAQGGQDAYLDSLMEKAANKTGLSGYDVVMLSLFEGVQNTSGGMFALALARYLKNKYNPLIIAGGTNREITAFTRHDTGAVDYIIRGKGEKTLFTLLTALKYGLGPRETPILKIIGQKEVSGPAADFWLNPDYSGLPLELYGYRNNRVIEGPDKELSALLGAFNESALRVAQFRLMEGCFFECIFCCCSTGREVFALSPKKAVERLLAIKDKYGLRNFFFLDTTINMSKKYVNEFCDELISSGAGILWSDSARADNLDRETLFKMREAGCVRLIYGMETASPRLLKYIEKNINIDRMADILRWTDEAGIMAGVETICGFPGETIEDLQMTVDFINKNAAVINMVYCTALYLEDGSKMRRQPDKYGLTNIQGAVSAAPELSSVKYGYDEINGLTWEERLKEMLAAHDFIINGILNKGAYDASLYDTEHLMFYLYSKFSDKKKIAGMLEAYNRYHHTA